MWLGKSAHRDFAAAVNGTGRPMWIDVVAGYFFLWGETGSVANTWRFCEDHHDAWKSTREQILCRADQANLTGAPGGWANMDFIMTGGAGCAAGSHCPGQSDAAYGLEFAIWSLTQSPLLVDTDVRNMTAIMRGLLLHRQLLALHQSTRTAPGRKLGVWAQCKDEPLACGLWGREADPDGRRWVVALANTGERPHRITLSFELLGWAPGTAADVETWWGGNATGGASAAGSVEAQVPPHGVSVLQLTAK